MNFRSLCHEGPPATRGHFRSETEVAARGRYYCNDNRKDDDNDNDHNSQNNNNTI